MRKHKAFFILIAAMTVLIGCGEKPENEKDILARISVKNTLDSARFNETVELILDSIAFDKKEYQNYGIKNSATGKFLIVQYVDEDLDGKMDKLLFQPELKSAEQLIFEFTRSDYISKKDSDTLRAFSRIVPERLDDYAWENDRVAFRTYGPKGQKSFENKVPGATRSSGIDCWLKKVEYPIIDKWYKKTTEKTGSYHEDTGEGLDNFHVGTSRGCGGTAKKIGDTYHFSENFINYKTLANGPIRTSFILEYGAWDAAGTAITETKRISLDYGNNLARFELTVLGTDSISAGLTLHKNEGETTADDGKGFISYWEPHEGSELGTGIVIASNHYGGHEKYVSDTPDLSNLYARLKVLENKAVYYAGFTWKESGQFKNKGAWESYLSDFSLKLASPLEVTIQKQKF